MQIEEGKYYKASNGKKVGPMRHDFGLIWDCKEVFPEDGNYHWCPDGKRGGAASWDCPDLIAEWTDAPLKLREFYINPEGRGMIEVFRVDEPLPHGWLHVREITPETT